MKDFLDGVKLGLELSALAAGATIGVALAGCAVFGAWELTSRVWALVRRLR